MIWSSSDRVVRRGALHPSGDASPWYCADLGAGSSADAPVDAATLEALREEELESAYLRGRAEGEQAGQARARKELTTALSATRRALKQVQEARESWQHTLEENLIALSMAVARRIVGRELEGDRESYRALIQEAVASFPMDQGVRIRLHPDDLEMLAGEGSGVPGEDVVGGRDARWITDEEIVPGGCVVEGPDRIVDGRVDAALERIFRELAHG